MPKVAAGLLLLGLFFWRPCELIKHVPYQSGHNADTCDNHDLEEKNILNLLGLVRGVSVSLPYVNNLESIAGVQDLLEQKH